MRRLILHVTISCITFVASICFTNVWNWMRRGHRPVTKIEGKVPEPVANLTPDEEELLEIFHNYGPAQTKHDSSFFENVEANEFMLFYQDGGKPLTRNQDIEWMKQSSSDVVYKNDVISLRVQGNAAVINSRMTATYANGTVDSWPGVDVCVKRNGHWQILSTTELDNEIR